MPWNAVRPLSRLEKTLLSVLLLGVLPAFGALVEYRSAFLTRRMGDLDVFLRAAWAVRTGEDLYRVTSENDWHYIYPPLCAILMTPLADPPRDSDTAGFVPYPISVAICFLFNVLCMVAAVHFLACAIEQTSGDTSFAKHPRWCLRWWLLRLLPVLVCMAPIGHTLMRGQANLLVLASLCAALAAWMRGLNFRAGIWLSFAICIKVLPIYLLVYPLWKRDGRALAGCSLGLLAGLGVVPLLVFGPSKTLTHYQTYAHVFFGPIFRLNDDPTLHEEITGVNSTDSIGVKDALHNWMYAGVGKRPNDMHIAAQVTYVLLGVAMTFLVLAPGTWVRQPAPMRDAHQFAALTLLMAIFSPVCHSHYMLFCVPMVMCLIAHAWQNQPTVHVPLRLTAIFFLFFGTMAVAYLPGLEILKDRCATLFATLPLWFIPVLQLWRPSFSDDPSWQSHETRQAA